MQFRVLAARSGGLLMVILALVCALVSYSPELRAEELASAAEPASPLALGLGVHFVEGSTSSLILERDGKQYLVDLATQTIRETGSTPRAALVEPQQTPAAGPAAGTNSGGAIFQKQCSSCHGADGKGGGAAGTPDLTARARSGITQQTIIEVITKGKPGTEMQAFGGSLSAAEIREVAAFVQSLPSRPDVYEIPDDYVYSLPTGRAITKGALYVNFAHRFAYDPAFSGPGLGNILLGLDGSSVSSFGFRYGITDKLSASIYRSPSIIGRPIEFMLGYNVLDEFQGHPFNAAVRVSIDGQDNFRRNFTTNLEGIVSRSFSDRAQLYIVPTFSIQNRRLDDHPGPRLSNRLPGLPGIDSFSLGGGHQAIRGPGGGGYSYACQRRRSGYSSTGIRFRHPEASCGTCFHSGVLDRPWYRGRAARRNSRDIC
jgi:mono/diheme cytochrome c family protein